MNPVRCRSPDPLQGSGIYAWKRDAEKILRTKIAEFKEIKMY
jgi:hypothetical protein